jgi:hypothetical protein
MSMLYLCNSSICECDSGKMKRLRWYIQTRTGIYPKKTTLIPTFHVYLGPLLFECLKFCKCRPYCRYISCGKEANDFCSNTATKHIYIYIYIYIMELCKHLPVETYLEYGRLFDSLLIQSAAYQAIDTTFLSSGHAAILTGGWLEGSSAVKWGFIPFRKWPDIRIKFQVIKRH